MKSAEAEAATTSVEILGPQVKSFPAPTKHTQTAEALALDSPTTPKSALHPAAEVPRRATRRVSASPEQATCQTATSDTGKGRRESIEATTQGPRASE